MLCLCFPKFVFALCWFNLLVDLVVLVFGLVLWLV